MFLREGSNLLYNFVTNGKKDFAKISFWNLNSTNVSFDRVFTLLTHNFGMHSRISGLVSCKVILWKIHKDRKSALFPMGYVSGEARDADLLLPQPGWLFLSYSSATTTHLLRLLWDPKTTLWRLWKVCCTVLWSLWLWLWAPYLWSHWDWMCNMLLHKRSEAHVTCFFCDHFQ